MAMSKSEAIRQLEGTGTVSNQSALVKRMTTAPIKPIKIVIPGGKTMVQVLDQTRLPTAVFTWLRGCRDFTEVTISLAHTPEQYVTKRSKVVDFDVRQKNFEWETKGKRWLAERIADVFFDTDKLISIEVDRTGIYKNVTESKKWKGVEGSDWEPYISFTPFRPV